MVVPLVGKVVVTPSRGASMPGRPRLAYMVAHLIGMLRRQHAVEEDPSRSTPQVT